MGVVQCAVGEDHHVALSEGKKKSGTTTTMTVHVWGGNGDTQATREQLMPRKVEVGHGLVSVASVAAGARHVMALTKEGLLFAWGENEMGQLGVGRKRKRKKGGGGKGGDEEPVLISLPICMSIECGTNHSGAITRGGDLYMWGTPFFFALFFSLLFSLF
jgi:alpha-tubulin suppressor-like RCC1 family protein